MNDCYMNLNFPNLYCFSGFFKKNEINLKEEFARKRPDLVEHIIWNPYAKAPSQNGIIGRVGIFFLTVP